MALTTIDDRGLKTPIDLLDNEKIRFGTGNDLEIYHDGSNSFISDAGTGGLKVLASDLYLRNPSDADMIYATSGGAVKLYHDGNKKLETESWGVTVTGSYNGTSHIRTVSDSAKITAGASNDIEMFHNGTDSGIVNNTGGLYIQNDGTVFIGDVGGNEFSAKFIDNGAVELYYDNEKRIETGGIGAKISHDGDTSLQLSDTSANAVSNWITAKTAGYAEYNCYKEGVGTKYPHVFVGYTTEYARIDDAGIKFNGDTSADNALDDYEEGTWSGSLIANSVPNTLYGTTTGRYTKIGREVKVSIKFDGVDVSGIATGNIIQIAGLPFTSINADDRDISSNFHTSNVGFDTSRTQKFMCAQNGTTFNGFETKDDSPGVVWYTNDWDSNDITMYFTGHYTT